MDFRNIKNKLLLSGLISIILLTFLSLFLDIKEFKNLIYTFDYKWLPLILVMAPINYLFRFIKWHYYLRLTNINICIKDSIIIFFSGFSMTLTPGKIGEFLKTYMIKQKYNIPLSTTSPLVLTERLTDGISMLILCAISLIDFQYGICPLIIISVFVILFILIVQNRNLCLKCIALLEKSKKFKIFSGKLKNFYESTFILFKWKNLFYSVLIGIISWSFEGLVVYYALIAMGFYITPLSSIFAVSFSSIVGGISMLPGGLFAVEGSMLGILILMNLPKTVSVSVTMITRFSTLWLGVIIGMLSIVVASRDKFFVLSKK